MLRAHVSRRHAAPRRPTRGTHGSVPRLHRHSCKYSTQSPLNLLSLSSEKYARFGPSNPPPGPKKERERSLLQGDEHDRGLDDTIFNQDEYRDELDSGLTTHMLRGYQRAIVEANEDIIRLSLKVMNKSAEERITAATEAIAELTSPGPQSPIEQVVQSYRAEFDKWNTPRVPPATEEIEPQRLSPVPDNPATWGSISAPLAFNEADYMKGLKEQYDLRKDDAALRRAALKEHMADLQQARTYPDAAAIAIAHNAMRLAVRENAMGEELDELLDVEDEAAEELEAEASPEEKLLAAAAAAAAARGSSSLSNVDEPDGNEEPLSAEEEAEYAADEQAIAEEDAANSAIRQVDEKDEGYEEDAEEDAEEKEKKEGEEQEEGKEDYSIQADGPDLRLAQAQAQGKQLEEVARSDHPLAGELGMYAEGSVSRVDMGLRIALHKLSDEAAAADAKAIEQQKQGTELELNRQTILSLRALLNGDQLRAQLDKLRQVLKDELPRATSNTVFAAEDMTDASDKDINDLVERLDIDPAEDISDGDRRAQIKSYLTMARDLKQGQDLSRLTAMEKLLETPAPVDLLVEKIPLMWAEQGIRERLEEEQLEQELEEKKHQDELYEDRKTAILKSKSHRKRMDPLEGLTFGEQEMIKSIGSKELHYLPHHIAMPTDPDDETWPVRKLIEVRTHTNVTKTGRVLSYSACLLIGNGRGSAGFGYARGKNAAEATDRALRDAYRNVITIDRYEDRTIPYPIVAKYCKTKVVMRGLENMSGLRVHPSMIELCDAFGLKDIFIKTYHRRVLAHMYKAIFNALEKIKAPETIAKERGKVYFNPSKVLNQRPQWGL